MSPVTPRPPGSCTRFSERYEIKNQAGMGGMGTVYQAIDRESGSLIALKILSASLSRPQDAADLRALAAVAAPADLELAKQALALIEARRFARGKRLLEEFGRLVAERG